MSTAHTNPPRAAVYNRASTTEQAEEGHNLKGDEDRCREHIDRKDWSYLASYIDGGEHGDDPNRPEYRRLLTDIAAGLIDVVVIPALDRFGRDSIEIKTRLALFDNLGVRIESLKETIDRETPEGRLQTGILAEFAEFELAKIRARTKAGIGARARKGTPWGAPKYGYRRRDGGEWEPDPAEVEVVARIVSYRVEKKMSYSGIARKLIAEKIPTRTGGHWTATTIKRIIEGREVRGWFQHNREWIKGRHEPIIDEDVWLAAQLLAAQGSKFSPSRPGRRPARHVFINGHARCHYCGEALLPRGDWYECRTNKALRGVGSCPMPRLRREDVDGHWLAFFERGFLDLEKTRDHLAAELNVRIREIDRELVAAESEVAKLETERTKIDRDYRSGELPAKDFARFSAALDDDQVAATAERDRLRRSAEEARQTTRSIGAEDELLRRLIALRNSIAADARAAQENGDLDALRAISRELAEEVAFGFTTSGHLTITGIAPGNRLLVPVYVPNDPDAVGVRFEKDAALPLAATNIC